MKVTVLYNADAGAGVSLEMLRKDIEQHRHEILHIIDKHDDLEQALDGSPELLVAAGGDGTVSRAASRIAGHGVALAILPLGTANNIARSLGLDGPVHDLIDQWDTAPRRAVDLGVLRASWGERRFLEAAGVGLVPAAISALTDEPRIDNARVRAKVPRAAQGYLDVLARLKPRERTLILDGARVTGSFLLVEVLNISSIGPNLVLAPDADASDGRFSVVTAEESEREALEAYLRDAAKGRDHTLRLPTRLAREIELEDVQDMHVDDRVRTWSTPETVSIRMEHAALQVLVGAGST